MDSGKWCQRSGVGRLCSCPQPNSDELHALPGLVTADRSMQVLSHEGKVFLRIANDRGWTYADSPEDGSVLFDKVASEISEDK